MNLNSIFNRHYTDKGDTAGAAHNYAPIYEIYMEPRRNSSLNFGEIGIDFGKSLSAWEEYFPKAQIYAADFDDKSHKATDRIHIGRADQRSFKSLMDWASHVPNLDFFIDDGGHAMDHQQITFAVLFPIMKSGGVYFIEDAHTSNLDLSHIYGQPMNLRGDKSNSTITVFRNYLLDGVLASEFFTHEIAEELEKMIDSVVVYDDNCMPADPKDDSFFEIKKHGVIAIKKR